MMNKVRSVTTSHVRKAMEDCADEELAMVQNMIDGLKDLLIVQQKNVERSKELYRNLQQQLSTLTAVLQRARVTNKLTKR